MDGDEGNRVKAAMRVLLWVPWVTEAQAEAFGVFCKFASRQ
jgi:hypothetical protein